MDSTKKPFVTHRKKVKHYDGLNDAHFVTFSCYQRLPLLSKDRTRHWFLEALASARMKHRFDVWAWVIMPEHVHLLIWPRQRETRIASILSSIKKPVGYKAIQFLAEKSPAFLERLTVVNKNRTYRRFWQAGPGYDKNLNKVAAIHNVVEYIHANPVRRELVASPTDWPWSSAKDWENREHPDFAVDRTLPILHPDQQ